MDVIELFELVKKGDKVARDKLVEDNIKLVYSIAKRYKGLGCEMEDLIQIGCIGLIKAIDKFDLSYNVAFSTYAVPVIAGEIKRFLRDDGPIKISRSIKDNLIKINRAKEKIRHIKEREATIDEIVKETNLIREDVMCALEGDVNLESIDNVIYDNKGNSVTFGERIENGKDEMGLKLNRIYVEGLVKRLEKKQRDVIIKRYFEEKKQSQIGDELGISQVQVSRIERKALKVLREIEENII